MPIPSIAVLDSLHGDPGAGPLLALGDVITRCFGAGTVVEIAARLARETGAHATWAAATRERLLARSPTALVVAHRLIREASAMELHDVLELEHALICRMMELPDLHAGVRARLGKTGEAPRWRPARLEDVSAATIDAIFSSPEAHHLRLPTRREMQEGMM